MKSENINKTDNPSAVEENPELNDKHAAPAPPETKTAAGAEDNPAGKPPALGGAASGGNGAAAAIESGSAVSSPAAEIQYPAVNRLLKMLLVGTFLITITVPLIVLLSFGSAETPLESEKEAKLEAPTVQSWFDASFQSGFELWFSSHYPSRSKFVKFYRQLKYDADSMTIINLQSLKVDEPDEETENLMDDEQVWEFMFDLDYNMYAEINLRRRDEAPVEPAGFKGSDAVLIGKSGYLFESSYINEYYGFSEPYISATKEGIVTLVEMLEYIQEQLARRGITMIYLLSSSKASQYSEFVPEWYKNTQYAPSDYVRPYTRLQGLLAESSLNYIDSSELFKQIGLYATFPKTGIHWNHLASFEATRAVLDKYCELTGVNARRLATRGVIETESPPSIGGSSDTDIFNILYGTIDKSGSVTDEYYYTPDGYVANADDGEHIGVLVQGGSFTHDVINYLRRYRITNNLQTFYYNQYSGQAKYSPFGNMGYYAWDILLEDIDLLIFEQTEQQIRSEFPTRDSYADEIGNPYMGSNVVYASLYYYLQDNEIS